MTAEKREQIINDYAEKYAPVLSPDDKDSAIAHSFYKSGMNAAFNLIGEKYDSNYYRLYTQRPGLRKDQTAGITFAYEIRGRYDFDTRVHAGKGSHKTKVFNRCR